MSSLLHSIPDIDGILGDARSLHALVGEASDLAEKVSSKVRLLDVTKSRVFECMKRVDDIIDLKDCVDGVQDAMRGRDFETAAAHVHRYLSLDESFLKETGSEPQRANTIASSLGVLQEASSQLSLVIEEGFDKAVLEGDQANIERFIKLFPLLNLHSEGIRKFSSFVCGQIGSSGVSAVSKLETTRDSGQLKEGAFGVSLNAFLELVAILIEKYGPVVETHYGPGWLMHMIQAVQVECDKHVGEICQMFVDSRQVQRRRSTMSTPGPSKPATQEKPSTKDIDGLLTEFAHVISSIELYFQYVRRKLIEDQKGMQEKGSEGQLDEEGLAVLTGSQTSSVEQDLISHYITLEHSFLQESYVKAIAMSTASSDALSSSVTDDLFFIIQKCLRRSSSCVAVDCVCTMMNFASTLLVTDFKEYLSQQLKKKPAVQEGGLDFVDFQAMFQPAMKESDGEDTPHVVLNDLELSIDNIQKLCTQLQAEWSKSSAKGVPESHQKKLDSCLANLRSCVAVFKALRQESVGYFWNQYVLPRVKPGIECFATIKWVVSQDEFQTYQINEPYAPQLIACLDAAFRELKPMLLPKTFEIIADEVVGSVSFLVEKEVMKSSFNQACACECSMCVSL
jgi:hypothetical protein